MILPRDKPPSKHYRHTKFRLVQRYGISFKNTSSFVDFIRGVPRKYLGESCSGREFCLAKLGGQEVFLVWDWQRDIPITALPIEARNRYRYAERKGK